MARRLCQLGLTVVVLVVGLLLAGEIGWLPTEALDPWFRNGGLLGAVLFACGVTLALLTPIGRLLAQKRCARCGRRIERGQTYCIDHLRAAVNEYRDQTREGMLRTPRVR